MNNSNIYFSFAQAAKRHADLIAVRDEDFAISYTELENLSRDVARAIIACGIEKGDRVAIWAVNRPEWIIAALGIQAAGGVLVPLSTRLRGNEVAAILRRADVKMIFSDGGFGRYDFIEALSQEALPATQHRICFDGGRDNFADWHAFIGGSGEVTQEALDERIASIGSDDLVDMLFTSGTTGQPKGVPLTHGQSFIACERQQEEISNLQPGDGYCIIFPFAHNAGYRAGWQIGLLYGARIVPVRSYDALDLLKLLHAERPTYLAAAPPLYRSMMDHPDLPHYDLSSVRRAGTGGTDVPPSLLQEMRQKLGVQSIFTGYGLTETAGSVTTTQLGDSDEVIAYTTGVAMSNLDVKCVDSDLNEVPVGTPGEILVRGPQVMRGYFGSPEAAAQSFTDDGFFRTGDIGRFDDAGNLAITGRLKDMYIVGGFNCYPAEIEQMLRKIPAVQDVAIVGMPDDRLGQVGMACIVCRKGMILTAEEVIAWSRDNMANYKVPRRVLFLPDLPRNAQGKVIKTELVASGTV